MVVAELKSMAVEPLGDSVRKLLVAEKQAHLQEQEGRLQGIRIRGELHSAFICISGPCCTYKGDKLHNLDSS